MSIYIRFNNKDRGAGRVKALANYVFDLGKTSEEYCHTLGVSRLDASIDMLLLKALYRKTGGRQVLHWVLSFDEDVTAELADEVGMKVLHLLEGKYQAIAATHINTLNRHVHFAINPIDIVTGKKFSESVKDMLTFREKINDILSDYNLSLIGQIESLDEENWDEGEIMPEKQEIQCGNVEENVMRITPDHTYYFPVMHQEFGHVWRGMAAIENNRLLEPGLYYGEPREGDFVVWEELDGKKYRGKGLVEDGKLYMPGFYEEV